LRHSFQEFGRRHKTKNSATKFRIRREIAGIPLFNSAIDSLRIIGSRTFCWLHRLGGRTERLLTHSNSKRRSRADALPGKSKGAKRSAAFARFRRSGLGAGLVKSRSEQTCKCQRCICSARRNFDPVEAERLRRRVRSENSAAGAEWRQ